MSRRRVPRPTMLALLAGAVAAMGHPAAAPASTTAEWAKLERETVAACTKAANLRDARVTSTVRFSDAFAMDARIVTGTWPQPHMQGRAGTVLCLYDRRRKLAEVQEIGEDWRTRLEVRGAPIRGTTWRATSIAGEPVPAGTRVTLQFDAGGRVGGTSGCNGYSARYVLDGAKLQVIPPLVGTRKACAPEPMRVERRFTDLLAAATAARIDAAGRLVVDTKGGASLEFAAESPGAGAADASFPSYRCGNERVKLRFDEQQAFAEFEDGVGTTLPRVTPDAAPGVRVYTNGRVTVAHAPDAPEPKVRLARGRMAPLPCTRIEE